MKHLKLALMLTFFLLLCQPVSYASKSAALDISVENATSNRVTIKWQPTHIQSKATIYLLPEPISSKSAKNVLKQELATLQGKKNTYQINNLVPNVDNFILVKSMSNKAAQTGMIHVKTKLAKNKPVNKINSIEMFAPNILACSIKNSNGVSWHKGNWSVKRGNGQKLEIIKKYRHTVPIGAPKYKVGVNLPSDDETIDVEHKIFLVFSEPVGSPEILRIKDPRGNNLTLPFSDKYLETSVIKVNQVGYYPLATKRFAYVYGYMGSGGVHNLEDFPVVANVFKEAKNPLKPKSKILSNLLVNTRSIFDNDAGGAVKEIDLLNLPPATNSYYRVQLPGIGISYKTAVSKTAYFKAFYVATRGLFHNRWGGDLKPDTTEWSRPADHPFVYTAEKTNFNEMFSDSTPKKGKRSLKGGYHDAGDFDQRPMHTGVPLVLLSVYEMHPEVFSDGQLTIPESGNGIPDLLDEALWGVQAWEQLQEKDGGVRMGVESTRHPYGFYLANEDPLTYYTYARHQNITARACGLFAQSSRLVEKFDKKRAKELKEKAIKAYNYAKSNKASAAFMLYAAGEMLLLTGDGAYKIEFERAWREMGAYGAFNKMALFHQPTPNALQYAQSKPKEAFAKADYITAYFKSPQKSKELVNLTFRWLDKLSGDLIDMGLNGHAFRNPRKPGSPMTWGRGASMGRFIDAAVLSIRLGDLFTNKKTDLIDVMSLSADYILGCNPLGMVFYTGLGTKNVKEPLHLDSLVFAKKGKGAMPGIPVFGPVDNPPGQRWSLPAVSKFFPAMGDQPRALRYGDVRTLVMCNESTTWGDYAPNVKLFGALLSAGMMPPESWLPGKENHTNPLPW